MADNKSREVIGGRRMCGKTTELIMRASKDDLYILCANKTMARFIFKQANDMGLKIPYPVTVEELPLKGYMKEILVDEVEMVLAALTGKQIVGMSTSLPLKDLPSLREGDKPNLTKRPERKGPRARTVGEIKVDIDCSDALKGLKAIQREAREATAALKELECQQNKSLIVKCKSMLSDRDREKIISKVQEGLKRGALIFDESCDYEFVNNITSVKVVNEHD